MQAQLFLRNLFLLLLTFFLTEASAQISDYSKARDAERRKDYASAVDLYTQVIKKKSASNIYSIYYRRAQCYYELNQLDKAAVDLNKASKISTKHPDYEDVMLSVYFLSATLSRLNNKLEESLVYLKKASEFSNTPSVYSTIAYTEASLGKYEDAVKTLTYALTLDGNHAYAYSNRAWAYAKLGKLDDALADVELAITLDPTNPYALKHRAIIFIEQNKLTEACADLHKAIELGYRTFGQNEPDHKEVDQLIEKHCR